MTSASSRPGYCPCGIPWDECDVQQHPDEPPPESTVRRLASRRVNELLCITCEARMTYTDTAFGRARAAQWESRHQHATGHDGAL